jgi:hypothetical protein
MTGSLATDEAEILIADGWTKIAKWTSEDVF